MQFAVHLLVAVRRVAAVIVAVVTASLNRQVGSTVTVEQLVAAVITAVQFAYNREQYVAELELESC